MSWLEGLLKQRPEAWERQMRRVALSVVGGGLIFSMGSEKPQAVERWKEQLMARLGPTMTEALMPAGDTPARVARLVIDDQSAHMELYALWTHRGIQAADAQDLRLLCWLDDRPEVRDSPAFRRLWNGTLRLFNLLQFLPHAYFMTSSGDDRADLAILIAQDLEAGDDPNQSTRGLMTMDWKAVRQEMLDEEGQALVDHLFDAHLVLPQAGYSLLDDQGHTQGADAELAWPDNKVAVIYMEPGNLEDEQAQATFEEAGWTTVAFDEAAQSPQRLVDMLEKLR